MSKYLLIITDNIVNDDSIILYDNKYDAYQKMNQFTDSNQYECKLYKVSERSL